MTSIDEDYKGLPIGAPHYRAYVGPPEKYDLVAAMQFNLLTNLGLREYHYLLDIGCGSLRAGRLFIPYLLPGHYYGIEPQEWLIEEGLRNELGREILKIKKPVFSHGANFNCIEFGQKFDFVMAQSIFSHASQSQIHECLTQVEKCILPGSLLVATFVKGKANYEGDEWEYPGCVTYTVRQMKRLAAASRLEAQTIDWPHPNGQTWLVMKRTSASVTWPWRRVR